MHEAITREVSFYFESDLPSTETRGARGCKCSQVFSNLLGACLFAKRRAVENAEEGLSEETKEALEMRLDPCVREAKRTTVMSIAYVPGNTAINESASVWCGMGSGAIMVYETNRWNCVSELRYVQLLQ